MSNYQETNRQIKVSGEESTEQSQIKYSFESKSDQEAPALITFKGDTKDTRFRGYYDRKKDRFSITLHGEAEDGLQDVITATIDDILGEFEQENPEE